MQLRRRLGRVIAVGGSSLVFAAACAAGPEGPLRSPSQDYPHPPPSTSDGEVVGADGVAPSDRLHEGPRGSADGAELSPGWKAGEEGIRHDPKQRTGGATDQTAVEVPSSPQGK